MSIIHSLEEAALVVAYELDLVAHYTPLGREDESYEWLTETSIALWFIYALRKK